MLGDARRVAVVGVLLALIVLNAAWRMLVPDAGAQEEQAAISGGCELGLVSVAWRHDGVRVGCLENLKDLLGEAAKGSGCVLDESEGNPPASGLSPGDRVLVMPGAGRSCVVEVEPIPGVERIALGIPIDVNRASREDLMALSGIGPALADAIIGDREESGPFGSVEELTRVRGIGPVRLERMAEHVIALPLEAD